MTAQKTYETCPICGRRSRRPDCLVCNKCRQEVLEPLGEENAAALLGEQFNDIVDPFEFVLEKGQETLERKQADLKEAQTERDAQRPELWKQAEREVAAIISSDRKGGDMTRHRIGRKMRHNSTIMRFRELKLENKAFKRAYGLSQSIKSLIAHLAGIQEKREEHLSAQQTENSVENSDSATEPESAMVA